MTADNLPQLGRYQVINKIAAGGMAEVFLARSVGAMGFQRLVAIKLIHSNFTRDEEFVKMFIDEARIAMHLHHRNIVQVFDLDKVGDTYFIAMEFVHGVNLYDLYERIASKNRWIDPSMALYIVAEVSKGLHFAHTRTAPDGRPLNIVHRDISPQNVLLSFEGEVKITDFGIATAAERLHQTAAGIVKGKYAYMAPERLQEKPTDGRVDVFSVGVLLYELLAGENPYAGASAVETIENVLQRVVPAPSERGARISTSLDDICLRALHKDPRQRYPTAQALADAVTEYALELTHARKDMATGDSSLAGLLAELFPERVKTPPQSLPAKELALPGLGHGNNNGARAQVQTFDTFPDPSDTPEELAETMERPGFKPDELRPGFKPDEARAVRNDRPDLAHNPGRTSEDFDAPTLLKVTPYPHAEGRPRLITRDESTDKGHESANQHSGLATLPPEPVPNSLRPAGSKSLFDSKDPESRLAEGRLAEGRLAEGRLPEGKGQAGGHAPVASARGIVPAFSAPSAEEDDVDHTAPTKLPDFGSAVFGPPTIKNPVAVTKTSAPLPHDDPYAATIPSDDMADPLSRDELRDLALGSAPRPQVNPVRPLRPIQHTPPRYAMPDFEPSSSGEPKLVVPLRGVGDSHDLPPPYPSGGHIAQPRPATNLNLIAGITLFIAAVMVAAAAVLVLSKNGRALAPLQITSEPPGARIIMNGRDQPQVTPVSLELDPSQSYYVELKLDGYEPFKREVGGGETFSPLHAVLVLQRASLTVLPTPSDATVIVNGVPRGQGKVTVTGLEATKPVLLQVVHQAYEGFENQLQFPPGQVLMTVPVVLSKRSR